MRISVKFCRSLTCWAGCLTSSLAFWGTAGAQIAINVPGTQIHIGQPATNEAANISGVIDPEAQIEGITIINQQVFIDGQEVPRKVKTFTSKKTKKTYLIQRDKHGNATVSEK